MHHNRRIEKAALFQWTDKLWNSNKKNQPYKRNLYSIVIAIIFYI